MVDFRLGRVGRITDGVDYGGDEGSIARRRCIAIGGGDGGGGSAGLGVRAGVVTVAVGLVVVYGFLCGRMNCGRLAIFGKMLEMSEFQIWLVSKFGSE